MAESMVRSPPRPRRPSGGSLDVRGLRALGALRHDELDARVLDEGLEAVALDFAEVREQVLAAVVRGDEAVALALVEPLHGAGLGRLHSMSFGDGKLPRRHMPRGAQRQ